MFGGSTGLTRMFGESMGTEISWLLPAALIALVAGLWFTRRAPRTDRTRASLMLWGGGWLVVTVVVFSFMKGGIMHPYYTIALAPAIGAVIGIGVRELWRGRQFVASRVVLSAMLVVTGGVEFHPARPHSGLAAMVAVDCFFGGLDPRVRGSAGRRAPPRPLDGRCRGGRFARRAGCDCRLHRGDGCR